jgi:hypothetical protein
MSLPSLIVGINMSLQDSNLREIYLYRPPVRDVSLLAVPLPQMSRYIFPPLRGTHNTEEYDGFQIHDVSNATILCRKKMVSALYFSY